VKLRITHLRVPLGANPKRIVPGLTPLYPASQILLGGTVPAARGGATLATLQLDDGTQIQAMATCSPKDNYCRKTGRELAVARLKQAVYDAFQDRDGVLFS
jgi:hypothetical protein